MSSLSLKHIYKSFGKVEVLTDINLDVETGEFVIFVGPSGCGKSTLLRIIAGLEDVTQGDIEIANQRVNEVPPSERGISMVFQTYALYPHLTVRKNMSLGLKQAKQKADYIKERVDFASKMLELEPYLERRPAELSGGQRQRVAIGRAIVRKPQLFLFDEPLSNLDAALRIKTRLEIARLHRELEATTIYVTHDQTEAMTLADKIVVLQDGKVEQFGSPMELYNDPDNIFVAGFLGSPSMNFMAPDLIGVANAKTFGIRPEHIVIADSGQLSGEVSHVEHLGAETNIFVKVAATDLVTIRLMGQHDYTIGAQVHLSFKTENIYLFDGAGRRVK